ncbi:YceD family protein [Castellaniella ginsengisoli]
MVIDATGFARAGSVLDGRIRTAQLTRLCQDLPDPQDGEMHWQIRGRYDAPSGQAWIDVEAQGPVRVVCQRCLEAFSLPLRVSSTLGLVETQAQLDAMDALEAEGQGPEIEYLVADQRLDVLGLVEDELILALPYAPRHETCPGDGDVPEPPRRPSPFAALKDLGKD